jgi:putative transcriptional regulator
MKKRNPEKYKHIRQAIGKRISDLRKLKNYTLAELGKKCGKKPQSIHRVEKGEVNASVKFLYAIACGLGISLNELLDFQL